VDARPEFAGHAADMYLEGSDQHRGWFMSSLMISVAMKGKAPYRQVLTHGFTVDGQGRKMSKSIGNTVSPQDVMNKLGADILVDARPEFAGHAADMYLEGSDQHRGWFMSSLMI
ncbi:hypothetical protein D8Y27_25500, partial [Escherichia coli]